MYLKWQERLDQSPDYRDFTLWPRIEMAHVPAHLRSRFLRNQQIAAQVLAGHSFRAVASLHNVALSRITQLMNRCLGGLATEVPPLTAGLFPYNHVAPSNRRSPLSTLATPRGNRNSFSYLLESVPGLSEHLDQMLSADLTDKPYAQNVTVTAFHKEFLRYLAEHHWPRDTYPYTTLTQGCEPCRIYYHRRRLELEMARLQRKQHAPPVTPPRPQPLAYQDIHIDEQLLDVNTSVTIELEGELIPLRLSRVTLLLAVDAATDCYLAYHLVLSRQPNQDDVLSLLYQLSQPWEPRPLTTIGLQYEPGACLPSALGGYVASTLSGIIRLDNALTHLAHSVRSYLCGAAIAATLHLGLPKQPKRRNFVEHAFDFLSNQLHRSKSTTGSHPRDPLRESAKNSKAPPALTLNALEDTLAVLLTSHNVRRQPRLGGQSPLDTLKFQCARCLLPLAPPNYIPYKSAYLRRKRVTVHRIEKDHRAPHINFEYVRYTGTALADSALIEKQVDVEFDIRDIRQLTVYTLHGKKLGVIVAPRSWQRFPHSLRTRKEIFKRNETAAHEVRDPLGEYYAALLKNKGNPSSALEAARVHREFTDLGRETVRLTPIPGRQTLMSANDSFEINDDFEVGDEYSDEIVMAWNPQITQRKGGAS